MWYCRIPEGSVGTMVRLGAAGPRSSGSIPGKGKRPLLPNRPDWLRGPTFVFNGCHQMFLMR